MGTELNRNDLVCLNEGVCRMDGDANDPFAPDNQTGLPICLCGASRDRYGDFCQFQQGQLPVEDLGCDLCGADGDDKKLCRDGFCGCVDGYHLAGQGGFQCVQSR